MEYIDKIEGKGSISPFQLPNYVFFFIKTVRLIHKTDLSQYPFNIFFAQAFHKTFLCADKVSG